jgi:hypothetical protein
MAVGNVGEIIATTLRNRSRQIADNVSNSNALLKRLSERGKIKLVGGGRNICQELEYQEMGTFVYYTGSGSLSGTPNSVIDMAEFSWKQAAVMVYATGLEINVQNTSKEAVLNLLEARLSNAEKTMANNLSTGIYSDGTGTGGLQITGLQALVADAPATGTVGGINRATDTWWRNQTLSAAVTSTTIEASMQALWILCTRGADVPDLICADSVTYQKFWTSLMAIQRIQTVEEGKRGWPVLKFVNADVVYDGDSGIASQHMYFLNTDYIYWRPHRDVNMVPDDKRLAYEADAITVPLLFAGNMTMSNAQLQGVFIDTTP